jgi:hypothetical protein
MFLPLPNYRSRYDFLAKRLRIEINSGVGYVGHGKQLLEIALIKRRLQTRENDPSGNR